MPDRGSYGLQKLDSVQARSAKCVAAVKDGCGLGVYLLACAQKADRDERLLAVMTRAATILDPQALFEVDEEIAIHIEELRVDARAQLWWKVEETERRIGRHCVCGDVVVRVLRKAV